MKEKEEKERELVKQKLRNQARSNEISFTVVEAFPIDIEDINYPDPLIDKSKSQIISVPHPEITSNVQPQILPVPKPNILPIYKPEAASISKPNIIPSAPKPIIPPKPDSLASKQDISTKPNIKR